MKSGITLQCVSCKVKKTISIEEASKLTDTPFCDACFMPMCTVSAHVKSRRTKQDLRDVFK